MKNWVAAIGVLVALTAPSAQAESTCKAKRIHYLQLHKGMSYVAAAKLIGCLGEETFGYDAGDLSMKSYTWRGDDYGSLTVSFLNNELDSVMQFGLK